MPRDRIHLMHILFLPPQAPQPVAWRPAADVRRCNDGWRVTFELAGVRPRDMELQAHGHRLTLRGVRRDADAEAGDRYYLIEIAHGSFERSLELPCRLDRAHITTRYRDGLLIVDIQPEEEAPR